MKAFLERWLESKAIAPSLVEEVQRVEVVESREAIIDSEPMLPSAPVMDNEIAWRVEAFLQQIPERGAIPFLVAREAVEPEADCCLSCGDPLSPGNAYRCGACSRAANVALEIAMSMSKTSACAAGRVD
jgi:hypothetical protein